MNGARTFWLALILAAGALSGCGSEPVWKRQIFALTIPADSPVPPARTNIVALGHLTVSPLFQSRSFNYRTAQNSYEHDPYADFLVSPERALAEPIRARLRIDGVFGRVIDPGSRLTPSVIVEASVNELDGDFRDPTHPIAEMAIHFIIYDVRQSGPERVLLDKECVGRTPLAQRTPAALVAAWDQDLRSIMDELNSEYAKTHFNDR